eukprot:5980820-Amphidinium_carterae.1
MKQRGVGMKQGTCKTSRRERASRALDDESLVCTFVASRSPLRGGSPVPIAIEWCRLHPAASQATWLGTSWPSYRQPLQAHRLSGYVSKKECCRVISNRAYARQVLKRCSAETKTLVNNYPNP